MEKGQWLRQLLAGCRAQDPRTKALRLTLQRATEGRARVPLGPEQTPSPGIHTQSLILSSAAPHRHPPPWTS